MGGGTAGRARTWAGRTLFVGLAVAGFLLISAPAIAAPLQLRLGSPGAADELLAATAPVAAAATGVLRRRRRDLRRRHLEEMETTGIGALVAALDARDHYTGAHSAAVVELAGAVARELEMAEEEVAEVEQVALLHDIGKIGIPDVILNKQGPLDEAEWRLMRQHPWIAARIVGSVESLAHLAPAVRAEHEQWDGLGYPDRLAGEQIPLASRIVLACDAYHAMVSDRPYRKSIGEGAAVEELRRNAGAQFCPSTVWALLAVLGVR